MDTIKIEMCSINTLKPYAKNPRKNDGAVDKVMASIKEFGFKNPIIVDSNMEIIAGHTRYKAAKKLKLDTVPIIKADDLTPEQIKAYRIADNKTGEFAEWDMELVNAELQDLLSVDYDISVTGFDFTELQVEEVKEDDFDVDANIPVEPITKRGDVWQLGRHRLMCGDSTSVNDVEKLMDGNKVDMVFTDPPYGISIVGGGGVPKFGKVGGDGVVDAKTYSTIIGDETTDTARDFYNTCISLGFENFIIWGGNYFTDFLTPSPCWIVWDKENSGNFADVELAWCSSKKGAKLYRWLWNGMSRKGDRKTEGITRVHPTQKPVGLFIDIFKDFEFNTCYDAFGGSGSTLITCEQTNRICYMMELDEKYCDVIIKRWETLTGNKAELIKG